MSSYTLDWTIDRRQETRFDWQIEGVSENQKIYRAHLIRRRALASITTSKDRAMESNRDRLKALSRRDFLTTSTLIGAAVTVGASSWLLSARSRSGNQLRGAQPPRRPKMKTRKLGTLEVSEIGAGAMSISANYGPPADIKQGIAVLRAAHERGVSIFRYCRSLRPLHQRRAGWSGARAHP